MLLLSVVSKSQMEVEIVTSVKSILPAQETLTIELKKEFTENHQIDLLSVDKQKGEAVFYS